MSIDNRFTSIAFPALRDVHQERREAQGTARGHAAGYASGLRAAAAEVAERATRLDAEHAAAVRQERVRVDRAVAALAAAVRAVDERMLPVISDAEQTLVETAVELAEAILCRELSAGEGSARAAIERALASVDRTSVRAVRLHPADLDALDDETRRLCTVDLVADSSLSRGDAIADLPDGYLDARIGTALARARAALTGSAS